MNKAAEFRTAAEVREAIRSGRWTQRTYGLAKGYVQANLAILPERYAFDFMRFCQRNPKPCPLLDVTDPGDPEPRRVAPGADLRTDLSGYFLYKDGVAVEQLSDIRHLWKKDSVGFVLGCSLSFDQAMIEADIPLRHLGRPDAQVSNYITNIPCEPAGIFHGPMVVSMRPTPRDLVIKVVEISSRYSLAHGAPVHIGDPAAIGIADLSQVAWGEVQSIEEDEVPVFWACGITPQSIAMEVKIPEMITHVSGYMFLTDLKLVDLCR